MKTALFIALVLVSAVTVSTGCAGLDFIRAVDGEAVKITCRNDHERELTAQLPERGGRRFIFRLYSGDVLEPAGAPPEVYPGSQSVCLSFRPFANLGK